MPSSRHPLVAVLLASTLALSACATQAPASARVSVTPTQPASVQTMAPGHTATTSPSASAASPTAPTETQMPAPTSTDGSVPGEKPSGSVQPGASLPAQASLDNVDCSKAKCIALTFDDGPSEYTSRLLDILKQQQIHATFFVLGAWAKLHPDAVRREAADGHVVGTHSWNHPDFSKMTDAQIMDQINRSVTEIQSLTGKKVTLLRPPYGAMKKPMPKTGLSIILWNTDTHDWQNWKVPNPQKTISAALAQARPGCILLLHDSHGPSVDAVAPIVSKLKAKGYTFVTIPELFDGKLQPDVIYTGRGK